ncbi:MAG: hypothetical protein IKP50_00285 [Bacilli bacterium]|nr:hypothetical protein [Bacilli bacterium]
MSKLDEIVKQVNKDWKENIASRGVIWKKLPKIPFTSPRLNYMLYGGIQRGRLHEFSGPEGGGKTSTALDLCKNAQKLFQEEYAEKLSNAKDEKEKAFIEAIGPQKVVYADCENTLDEDWARTLGVDVDGMYILKPQTQAAEDIFQIVLDMLNTGECGLAIIDSLGVMMSKQAYEKSMDEKTYGGISMPLTLFSKKAELACHKYNATVIGINQERADMNNPYGGTTTPGGMGWKYNCTTRLRFSKGDLLDEDGNKLTRSSEFAAGNRVMVGLLKQKGDKPDRRLSFYTLTYKNGIDEIADLIEVALKYGYIQKGGAWFSFVDIETGEVVTDEEGKEIKVQGQSNVAKLLRENDVLLDELRAQIEGAMNG